MKLPIYVVVSLLMIMGAITMLSAIALVFSGDTQKGIIGGIIGILFEAFAGLLYRVHHAATYLERVERLLELRKEHKS